ncbi:MAG: hypothetical protein ACOYNR_13675 [Blastocatellia bacterium]|jgi:hypothetical protein
MANERGWKEAIEEAKRLFFLSVGISNAGGRRYRPDLSAILQEAGWQRQNCQAAIVDYEGKWGLRLTDHPEEGAVWLIAHPFSTGKIDLRLAAIPQQVGLLFRAQDASTDVPDRLSFTFLPSQAGATIPLTVIYREGEAQHQVEHELPRRLRGEWIPFRVLVTRELLSVFVNQDHVPVLKVPLSLSRPRRQVLGLWRGPGAAALLTDLRLIETDEWNLS